MRNKCVSNDVFLHGIDNVKKQCHEEAMLPCHEIEEIFPPHELMEAFSIIYPQFWCDNNNCE
jgi:hypothetical protein